MSIISEILSRTNDVPVPAEPATKRIVLLLRWTLFVSLLGLGFADQTDFFHSVLVELALGTFFAANLAISVVPERFLQAAPFKFSLSLLDTAIVSYVVYEADASATLCLFFFILLISTAASTRMTQVVLGSVVLGGLYLMMSGLREAGPTLLPLHRLMVLPLFYSTGLYFGHQVLRIRARDAELHQVFRERQELKTVLSVLESITSTLDFHAVMFEIAARIAGVLDAVRCSILLVEETPGRRAFVVAANDDRMLNMLPVDLEKYPEIKAAIRSKEPVIIEDVEKSELMRPYAADLLKLNFRSILVLPILYHEAVLGTLFLRASHRRSFTPGELKFCRVVAHAAASAIKNSLLYRSLADRARQLEETGARIRVLLDNSPDLILQLSPDGRICETNRMAETLSGLGRQEVLSFSADQLLKGLPPVSVLLDPNQGTAPPQPYQVVLATADGAGRELVMTAAPLSEPGGGLILIGRDVTEQNQATAMLQQTEKLSSIGEIVASVAHELNNPLSGVLGFSQLLAQKDGEGRFRKDIERIVDCAGRCQKIVQNLLSFARPARPEKKPVGLNGILEKTLDLLEPALRADNIEVVREITPELPYVVADFHQVQQVLINLITNAQQAVSAARVPGRLILRTARLDGRVLVEVADNGPGIPSSILPRIFDPFFSTKKQGRGTGLGLSVSYGIVRDHGGEIKVDSRMGAGTTFSVYFPIYVAEKAVAAAARPALPAVSGGKEILVVDDEEMIVELYLQLLQALGHSVDTASTGVEALRKLEAGDYDLVITDIKMPKMSGIQLYEKAVAVKPELKRRFIFITGDMNCLNNQQISTVVDNPCLLKPVSLEKIEATIHQVLAGSTDASPLSASLN